MKKDIILDMDTAVETSETARIPHNLHSNQSSYDLKTPGQQVVETLLQKLVYAVKTGNKQDQIQIVHRYYQQVVEGRKQRDARVIPYTRFLLSVRDYLTSQGLTLCDEVRLSHSCK